MASIKERLKPDSTFKIAYGDRRETLNEPRFILAYWSIRGLGAALRMMLSAAQVNHWIICYDVTEKGDDEWDNQSYLGDKVWLRDEFNPLMNLPFLVDCSTDRVIVQTGAIFCYLGRELSMLGMNPLEQSHCEELLCEVMDIRSQMVGFAYGPSSEHDKDDAQKMVRAASKSYDKLEYYLSKKNDIMVASNESPDTTRESSIGHLVGNAYSAPDFHLYEMLDQSEGLVQFYSLEPFLLESRYPNLVAYKKAFETLPQVTVYLRSSLSKLPYNNPYARFGSNPSTLGMYKRGMKTPWMKQGIVEELRSEII